MNRNDFGLVKNLTSAGPIGKRRIAIFAAADGKVEQAASAAAAPLGVTGVVGTIAANERVDIYLDGVHDVEAGGAFAQGDYICADAQGRAIKCQPAAGVTAHAVGMAMAASVGIGQLVPAHISRTAIKG